MPVVVTHFAARAGDHNDRAMVGSQLLAAAFGDRYATTPHVIGSPRPALSTTWKVELDAARADLEKMQTQYEEILSSGSSPVTALSRCAVALSTLPVVARHRTDAVVLWFDAHADLNTPETTPTGYLGGLAYSGPLGMWDSGLGAGLAPEKAILVGTRDIDPAEKDLIDNGVVALIKPDPEAADKLREAINGRPVYVHIDCDVLNPGIVPTDYQVPSGLSLEDLCAIATVVAESEIVGIEVGEFEAEPEHTPALAGPLLNALTPILDALV